MEEDDLFTDIEDQASTIKTPLKGPEAADNIDSDTEKADQNPKKRKSEMHDEKFALDEVMDEEEIDEENDADLEYDGTGKGFFIKSQLFYERIEHRKILKCLSGKYAKNMRALLYHSPLFLDHTHAWPFLKTPQQPPDFTPVQLEIEREIKWIINSASLSDQSDDLDAESAPCVMALIDDDDTLLTQTEKNILSTTGDTNTIDDPDLNSLDDEEELDNEHQMIADDTFSLFQAMLDKILLVKISQNLVKQIGPTYELGSKKLLSPVSIVTIARNGLIDVKPQPTESENLDHEIIQKGYDMNVIVDKSKRLPRKVVDNFETRVKHFYDYIYDFE